MSSGNLFGNCFFSAQAYSVSGSQKQQHRLRRVIVEHKVTSRLVILLAPHVTPGLSVPDYYENIVRPRVEPGALMLKYGLSQT